MKKLLLAASLGALMAGSAFATDAAPVGKKLPVTDTIGMIAVFANETCLVSVDKKLHNFGVILPSQQTANRDFKIKLEDCSVANGHKVKITFPSGVGQDVAVENGKLKNLATSTENPASGVYFKVVNSSGTDVLTADYSDELSLNTPSTGNADSKLGAEFTYTNFY